jgi:hypothetical protein
MAGNRLSDKDMRKIKESGRPDTEPDVLRKIGEIA